jgi:hypothetical protein
MKNLLIICVLFLLTSCYGVKMPATKYYHRQHVNNISQRHYQTCRQSTISDNWSLRPQGDWMRRINKYY